MSQLLEKMRKMRELGSRILAWFSDIVMPVDDVNHAGFTLVSNLFDEVFKALRLDEEAVRDFYDCFRRIDLDKSDTIEYTELIDFFSLPDTKFMERLYEDCDTDDSGSIDFGEFVALTWNICSRTQKALTRYLYDIFDDDNNGFLTPPEVVALAKLISPSDEPGDTVADLVMANLDTNKDGVVSFDELVAFLNTNSTIVEPPYEFKFMIPHLQRFNQVMYTCENLFFD